MWAWYTFWPIFSVIITLVIDRLLHDEWYWQYENNYYRLWRRG